MSLGEKLRANEETTLPRVDGMQKPLKSLSTTEKTLMAQWMSSAVDQSLQKRTELPLAILGPTLLVMSSTRHWRRLTKF